MAEVSLSAQDKAQAERGALKALKAARLKIGFGDDLRLIVSNQMMTVMMADVDGRSDWNMMKEYEEWQGLPVIVDRRLKGVDAEFVKVWSHRNEASWQLSKGKVVE